MRAMFSRLSKRERLLVTLTISVVAALAFFIFIADPAYKKWLNLGASVESANARLLKNLKLLANKESLEKEYDKYKLYIQKGEGGEEEISSILKEIEATAAGSGVDVTSIKPKGTKSFKEYKKFTVEVTGEAKLNSFLKFIYELEGSRKLLKVERLVLSLKSAQSDTLRGTLIIRKISF
jgi:Tfp pilus assembly protein PilO